MRKWLAILIFCLGLGVVGYPAANNLVTEWRQEGVLTAYKSQLKTASAGQLRALRRALQRQETVNKTQVKDPFKTRTERFVETTPLALVAIPSVDVELPVFEGTSEKVLQKYAGLVQGTDIPQGKQNQHSLITAHRGLTGNQLFTDLWRVEKGDRFYLKNAYGMMTYKVTSIRQVKANASRPIQRDATKNQVTLMTCTPYMVNSHRLLVTGHKIPNEVETIPEGKLVWDWYKVMLLVLVGVLFIWGMWAGIRYNRQAKEDL